MLRFNFLRDFDKFFLKLFQYILCYGSTYLINNNFVGAHKFQYILCYGSTKILIGMIVQILYFNTSYVTVQLNSTSENGSPCAISIHPMLRFNVVLSMFFICMVYFNTSYVTVQPSNQLSFLPKTKNFNTSYVTVQLYQKNYPKLQQLISIHPMLRFNFVKLLEEIKQIKFQYILCYGSTIGVM